MTKKISLWDVFLLFILGVILARFINKFVLDDDIKDFCHEKFNEFKERVRK